MGDTTAAVLATASAGNASGTQYLETARTLPVPPNPATATLTSDKPSWMLLEIGDTVTVTATVTDADGAAVSDGTTVTWLIITGGFTTVSTETVTTAGSATATLQAAEMGKGIGTATVRIGDVLGTVGLPWIGSYPRSARRPGPLTAPAPTIRTASCRLIRRCRSARHSRPPARDRPSTSPRVRCASREIRIGSRPAAPH